MPYLYDLSDNKNRQLRRMKARKKKKKKKSHRRSPRRMANRPIRRKTRMIQRSPNLEMSSDVRERNARKERVAHECEIYRKLIYSLSFSSKNYFVFF